MGYPDNVLASDEQVVLHRHVAPPPEALVHAQDKLVMRRELAALGAPIPRFTTVQTIDDVDVFAARTGRPVVIKTVRDSGSPRLLLHHEHGFQ